VKWVDKSVTCTGDWGVKARIFVTAVREGGLREREYEQAIEVAREGTSGWENEFVRQMETTEISRQEERKRVIGRRGR
jgi:hypothetical protein